MPPGELHFSEMKQGKNGFGRKEGWEARKDGGRNCSGPVLHERRIKKTNLKREQNLHILFCLVLIF